MQQYLKGPKKLLQLYSYWINHHFDYLSHSQAFLVIDIMWSTFTYLHNMYICMYDQYALLAVTCKFVVSIHFITYILQSSWVIQGAMGDHSWIWFSSSKSIILALLGDMYVEYTSTYIDKLTKISCNMINITNITNIPWKKHLHK